MRISNLDTALLCDQRPLGEHRELYALWSILTSGKRGYSHHPETFRCVCLFRDPRPANASS